MHSHKTSSPNPLPNPDITDHTGGGGGGYQQHHHNRSHNMPPSLLENIAENYNRRAADAAATDAVQYDNDRYKYGGLNGTGSVLAGSGLLHGAAGAATAAAEAADRESIYGRKKDYQDNYGGDYSVDGGGATTMAQSTGLYGTRAPAASQSPHMGNYAVQQQHQQPHPGSPHPPPSHYGSEKEFGGTPTMHVVQQMRAYTSPLPPTMVQQHPQQHPSAENMYHVYDKQRPGYFIAAAGHESPYMSKERLQSAAGGPTTTATAAEPLYSPRDNRHYGLTSPVPPAMSAMYGSAAVANGVAESMGSVHSMLKNDYQVCQGI